ncbi:hypothetical protein CTAYLR_002240 [Chrysophaeum taylorii]|uniref:Uncharacterized protein n=1 Tax=Chrysophaeum taylorii TaxID=2483200 RepID=A0AAD7UNR7_9STRA|nr:hypothetical protein CTAYLR_002240 [Chrysophaeum taylorii]
MQSSMGFAFVAFAVPCIAFSVPQNAVLRLPGSSVPRRRPAAVTTPKMSMMGGGILGVGTPELLVVCAAGYFLLGPQELYKLAREIGKLVSNARAAVIASAAEWQSTMDQQLDLSELRDVQAAARELQDAFNFRSERYMNEWRQYNRGPYSDIPDVLPEPDPAPEADDKFKQQLEIDDWNAKIMANDKTDPLVFMEKKQKALEQIERDYDRKRRELDLEYEYERQKLQVEFASSEQELAHFDDSPTSSSSSEVGKA